MTDHHHSLTLGDLTLTGDPGLPDETHGFWFEVCAEGTEFGSPEATAQIVQSLLADGDLVRYSRDGNRTIPVRVRVNGPDLLAVAHGEAALRRESKRDNEFTWQPPDYFAPPSVYETFSSPMSRVSDGDWDLDEKLRRVRTFALSLTCSPFARSAALVTIPALSPPGSPTTVTINNADTTTDWTAEYSFYPHAVLLPVTPTDEGSYVRAEVTGESPRLLLTLTTAAVSMATTQYLKAEVSGLRAGIAVAYRIWVDGVLRTVSPVLAQATTAGTTLLFFDTEPWGTSLTGFRVQASEYLSGSRTVGINVHDVSRTNTLDQVSPKQISRIIEVGGTERTPASIHVAAEDGVEPLGPVIVHTGPEDGSGYSPPLRRWRIAGGTVLTDASGVTLSGEYELITPTSFGAEVPSSALPEGGYLLAARLGADTAVGNIQITWATSTKIASAEGLGNVQDVTTWNFAEGNKWYFVPLGILSLPSVRSMNGAVQIGINAPSIYLDDAWLFRIDDDCALTVLETTEANLWLDSPDVTSPVPRVWVGDTFEGRYHPNVGLSGMGLHVLSPEGTATFTAALSDNPATDATFYRRWHSNAAG